MGEQKQIPEICADKCACCYLAFYLPVGTVISIDGIKTVQEFDYTHRNNLDNIKVGMQTKVYTDKTSRFFITVSANDRGELDDRIEGIKVILDQIKVRTVSGETKGPIWDNDK